MVKAAFSLYMGLVEQVKHMFSAAIRSKGEIVLNVASSGIAGGGEQPIQGLEFHLILTSLPPAICIQELTWPN